MTGPGTVKHIHVAPAQGDPMQSVDEIEAVEHQGLRGDRYFSGEGTFTGRKGCDVTFMEEEMIAAIERDYDIDLDPGVHRRNITTTDIALNHLVGADFCVGSVVCEGVELREPCAYLEQHLDQTGIRTALVHQGGLRASILEGGTIERGDAVTPL
jgi:MOSC domain-containing protein YiiM